MELKQYSFLGKRLPKAKEQSVSP